LQTQQILGAPKPAKPAGDVELRLDSESMEGLDTVTLAAPVSLAFVARNANAAVATPELELVVLDDDEAPADDAGGAGDPENSEKEKGAGFRAGSRGDADGALVFEASSPGIAVDGARAVRLGRLAPGASARAVVTVVPLRCGARRAPGVAVREATEQGRTYAYMRGIELVVKRA